MRGFMIGHVADRTVVPIGIEAELNADDATLTLLDTATGPRATLVSSIQWSESEDWKYDFYNIERLSEQERRKLREKFDQDKAIAKKKKQTEGRANSC